MLEPLPQAAPWAFTPREADERATQDTRGARAAHKLYLTCLVLCNAMMVVGLAKPLEDLASTLGLRQPTAVHQPQPVPRRPPFHHEIVRPSSPRWLA